MSDESPIDELTLEDYNKILQPRKLRLIEKQGDDGIHSGFLLQQTGSGDTWLDIFSNNLSIAVLQTESFIRGGQIAVVRCQEDIQEFLSSVQEKNGEDIAPDDLAKATAYRQWLRKQDGLKFLDEISANLAKKSGGSIVEFVDPKTNLISHAFADRNGKHEWIIPHEDKVVAALVVDALIGGFREGTVLANFQMNQPQPTIH